MQHQFTTPTAPKAAIYCRVSTHGQEDNYSLASQLQACRDYAESRGYVVEERYVYQEVASSFTLDRPQLTQLRDDLERGSITAVIVIAFDRWSSRNEDLYRLLTDIEIAGASLESVTEGVFENTAIGRAVLSMRTTGRELWREAHTERIKRGRLARAQSGMLLPGRKPAYGYRWREPVKGATKRHCAYERDPLTALVVERMFKTLASGGSTNQLKREFEAEGIPAPLGGSQWSLGTLGRLVRDPKYKGEAEMRRTRTDRRAKHGPQTTFLPEDERVKLPADVVPALVSAELWERANAHLSHSGRHNRRREPEPERYLLRGGFVVCAHCGRALGTRHYRHTHRYRIQPTHARAHGCPDTSIDSGILDTAVWELVEQIIKHPDRILDKIVEDFTSETDPTERDRTALEKLLKDLERKQRMQVLAIEELEDEEQAAPNILRLKQLATEIQSVTTELAEIEQRREGWASGLAAASRLTERFQQEQDRLDTLTYEEKRVTLSWLGVTVKLWPSGTSPRWELTTKLKLPAWPWAEPGPDEPDLDTLPVLEPAQYAGREHFFDDADHPRFRELIEGLACQSTSSLRYRSPK